VVRPRRSPGTEPPPAIGEPALRVARERIAVSAAAWGVEPEDIAGTQRVVGVACGQALRRGGVRVDPEVAAAAVAAAGAAVRGDEMLHGADRKACISESEVVAADAGSAAGLRRPAANR